jgi:outer membrane protein OmpA-like peptidoglycan-associated protein
MVTEFVESSTETRSGFKAFETAHRSVDRTMVLLNPIIGWSGVSHLYAANELFGFRSSRGGPTISWPDGSTQESRIVVMLGSMSGVASAGAIPPSTDKPPVYRIWAVVADLRTDKVIDRQMAWVKADEIDTTPVAFFADSPAWTPDPHAAAYVKTCSSTAGMPVDPVYRRALQTEAIVADAIKLYGAGRYDDALARYRQASTQDEGTQLRVLNGLYLSDWALGRRQAAEQDFGRVVDYGLGQGRLAVKFVFRPASTSFWPDPAISGPYRMWVRQIARRADASGTCLALTGHTSTTGDPAVNDRLSLARAEAVRGRIAANEPDMRRRTSAAGLGSREVLIGTGRDDVTDALDRRVEVKPIKDGSCGT